MPANGRWDLIRRLKVKVCFCLTVQPTFTINWLLQDVPLMIMRVECLTRAAIIDSLFLPSGLSYINRPDIPLYLLTVFKLPVELFMHGFPIEFFYFLVFNAGLKLILDIIWRIFLCYIHFLLDQLLVAGYIWLYRSNILALT